MKRTRDAVGTVLSRNEIWLLLHALNTASPPPLGWDGLPLEPWELGELQAKLLEALNPDPVKDVDDRPLITVDSDMGRSLALAGIRPLVVSDGYDIGSLLAACAERGWGVDLVLPRGAIPPTPAMAIVRSRRDRGPDLPDEATYVGLERPVVALARALMGALVEARSAEDLPAAGLAQTAVNAGAPKAAYASHDRFEEYVIQRAAIGTGRAPAVIAQMAQQGWELTAEAGDGPDGRLVFRRPKPTPESEAG